MKKLLIVMFVLAVHFQLIAQTNFVQPTRLKADNFPGHVELSWKNSPGFLLIKSFVPSTYPQNLLK